MEPTSDEASATQEPELLAVSYLRVSTREQAERGGTEEGFSIPAQREANARKAAGLGARIVREFVDAGESARSADRPALQEMLAFIAATRVQVCLVHKVDRLARNRLDDVHIQQALMEAGVTLVSATESIDETPSGMLVHGIMSSIAEFYSRNLATEVTKGMTQKVAQGGTPMRAPIGYLNVRRTDEQGREVRTVEIDPERAPLIRWAFETYARGETSVVQLLLDITARGLVTVPSPKRPSKPLGRNTLYKLLSNPYYAGIIRYKGALHPGAHEPLIEPALFDQVQSLLKARNAHATRHVQHAHHLKGLLFCGNCGSRMLLDYATNPRGTTYAYFVCSGRAAKKTACTRRAVPVQVAERLVEDSYASITISEADYQHLAADIDTAFDQRSAARDQELADLTANRGRLESESDKLLAAHFADAIDLTTLKRHQDRIRAGLADIDQRLAAHTEQYTGGRAFLHDSLSLLTDAHHMYAHSDDANRRLACQALYERLEITDDEHLRPHLAEPFATLIGNDTSTGASEDPGNAEREHPTSTNVKCSRKELLVELRGLEPLTPCMPCRCATSCAIAPCDSENSTTLVSVTPARTISERPSQALRFRFPVNDSIILDRMLAPAQIVGGEPLRRRAWRRRRQEAGPRAAARRWPGNRPRAARARRTRGPRRAARGSRRRRSRAAPSGPRPCPRGAAGGGRTARSAPPPRRPPRRRPVARWARTPP
ncbi:recombinase [Kocuria varians]|uniref:Recombinase n=1 Tax=Kocuria varians TaxID=1272 RepID=A0A4Y4D6I8_KOCVA|nr:recombinase [Kocuria varians]